jgi:hypothetical protein
LIYSKLKVVACLLISNHFVCCSADVASIDIPNSVTNIEKIDSYAGEEITLEKGVYILRVGSVTVKVKM